VELKQQSVAPIRVLLQTSNRTKVELKLTYSECYVPFLFTSNRTKVELKHGSGRFAKYDYRFQSNQSGIETGMGVIMSKKNGDLPIEPKWN